MSNNKDRKDFNKLNINRDIKEEFMRTAKDIEDTPTKSKSTKKPAVRGRPKGAKNKVKKPAKIAPVRIGAKGNNKAKKTTQGAGVQKHVETRRDRVVQELLRAKYTIPVIQESTEVGIRGIINIQDVMGTVVDIQCMGGGKARLTIVWVMFDPIVDMLAKDYVLAPVYLMEHEEDVGMRISLLAMRLVHKRHVDVTDKDPQWFDINIIDN